jgi:hypothetical protein
VRQPGMVGALKCTFIDSNNVKRTCGAGVFKFLAEAKLAENYLSRYLTIIPNGQLFSVRHPCAAFMLIKTQTN